LSYILAISCLWNCKVGEVLRVRATPLMTGAWETGALEGAGGADTGAGT